MYGADSDSGSLSRVDSRGAAVGGEGCTVPGCVLGVRESRGVCRAPDRRSPEAASCLVPAHYWSTSHLASDAVPDMSAGAQEM